MRFSVSGRSKAALHLGLRGSQDWAIWRIGFIHIAETRDSSEGQLIQALKGFLSWSHPGTTGHSVEYWKQKQDQESQRFPKGP